MKTFSPKDPNEIVILGIGFTKIRKSGETATACTFKAFDNPGTESTGVLDTLPADVSGWPIVRQRAVGGEAGHTYVIEATVTTSLGRTLIGRVKLPVSIQ